MSVIVAFFLDNYAYKPENMINDFCKDKKVIDIKYQSMVAGYAINDRLLVIYEEEDEDEKD